MNFIKISLLFCVMGFVTACSRGPAEQSESAESGPKSEIGREIAGAKKVGKDLQDRDQKMADMARELEETGE